MIGLGIGLSIGSFGGSATPQALSGAGSPVGTVTPEFVGQHYLQNPGPSQEYWYSTGLTNADWTLEIT